MSSDNLIRCWLATRDLPCESRPIRADRREQLLNEETARKEVPFGLEKTFLRSCLHSLSQRCKGHLSHLLSRVLGSFLA